MGDDDNAVLKRLKDFTDWVDGFCDVNHIIYCSYSDDAEKALSLKYEDLVSLNYEECVANSVVLLNYGSYLQKIVDAMTNKSNWCRSCMDNILARNWNNFDNKVPWEVKRHMIIADNSYAIELEKQRLRIDAALQVATENCKDVKKRVSIFQDLAKKKAFS